LDGTRHSAATRPSSFAVSGFDQAREAAKVRLGQVAKGINPRVERLRLKAEKDRERAEAALSFEALVDERSQPHLAHRRKRYREEAQRVIKHTFVDLLKRPAARIARAEIINVLDKLVRSAKAVAAARSLAYARAAFNWTAKREKVPRNPFVGLPVATVTVERERVLSDAELADVWFGASNMMIARHAESETSSPRVRCRRQQRKSDAFRVFGYERGDQRRHRDAALCGLLPRTDTADGHRRGATGDQRKVGGHVVELDPNRNALREAHPTERRIDQGQ